MNVRIHVISSLLAACGLCGLLACEEVEALRQEPGWTQKELERVTARIQKEVEAIRGAEFERPVEVRVTDKPGFVRYAKERVESMMPPEEQEYEETIAKLLGVVEPSVDMWSAAMNLLEEQVGGFYDPGSDTFFLMESFTGKVAEIILSHELTHALDDQLYGIDERLKELLHNGDAIQAYSSVVEGSGTVVMTRWALEYGGTLSPEDLAQASDLGTESLATAPPYLWKPLLSSYISGQKFLSRGYRVRKRDGKTLSDVIGEAFENVPLSTEQVLHPDKYWKADEWDAPRRVEYQLAELSGGWQLVTEHVLGELVLALVAASPSEREPIDFANPLAFATLRYTNDAATGWGGDALALLSRGEARMAHVVTLWDSEQDAAEFLAALRVLEPEWLEALAQLDTTGAGHGLIVREGVAVDAVVFASWFGAPQGEVEGLLEAIAWDERAEDEGGEERR